MNSLLIENLIETSWGNTREFLPETLSQGMLASHELNTIWTYFHEVIFS